MWGIEHTAMASIGTVVICVLFILRPFWAMCAAISLIPFWAGSYVYLSSGLSPASTNLAIDISVSITFLLLAHLTGLSGALLLCIITFSMAVLDLLHLSGLAQPWVELHEGLHYTALIIAFGGHRVGNVFGPLFGVRSGGGN